MMKEMEWAQFWSLTDPPGSRFPLCHLWALLLSKFTFSELSFLFCKIGILNGFPRAVLRTIWNCLCKIYLALGIFPKSVSGCELPAHFASSNKTLLPDFFFFLTESLTHYNCRVSVKTQRPYKRGWDLGLYFPSHAQAAQQW